MGRNPKQLLQNRSVLEFVSSKPQNTVHAPSTITFASVAVAPSSVARSPGYCRTTIGAAAVPFRVLMNPPRYVPPRSQMVSPGCTRPWPPLKAVCKSHGRPEPSPALEPLGDTYHPGTTIVATAAVPRYVATTAVRPGCTAVARPVCGPVLTTVATAGPTLAHSTCPATGLPFASRMLAVRLTVSATVNVSTAGCSVSLKLPNVALMGTLPVKGISTIEIV